MRLQVLAVDPSRSVAATLAAIFEPDRYALLWAADLTAGRTTLPRLARLDLVLLDVALPDGDGLELCRQMKRTRPELPVVVLTAKSEMRDAARVAGADLFFTKPFEADDLRRAVRRLLATTPRQLVG